VWLTFNYHNMHFTVRQLGTMIVPQPLHMYCQEVACVPDAALKRNHKAMHTHEVLVRFKLHHTLVCYSA
jgi:hypothetical protein